MINLQEDSTNNVKVGMAILVLILLIMQAVCFQYLKNNSEKVFTVGVSLLSIIIWFITKDL
ncbi:hypothetical protein BGI33_11885 [Snodgrassella alvi]|uniref:Uncharacterized protein n=1 Tax=Snodgrassella alvi TaxID=1196083 RepID=A0A2N9WS99_9NEIS|nr:hypothetical protein BGI33_11885 [Snodgrassella alvi]PIT13605.1 hypothetical protein BGI32_09040 [Snodgrassella alvi]PIT21382.1 hypothetical protein BGI34_01395 [Snodgrassella alvi]